MHSLVGSNDPNRKYILKIRHEDGMKYNTKIHMHSLKALKKYRLNIARKILSPATLDKTVYPSKKFWKSLTKLFSASSLA